MAWSGPACTLPGFVGARRGLRCTAVPGVQAWQCWTPPEPPRGLVTHRSCPGGQRPRGSRGSRRGAGSVRLAEAQGSRGVGVSELGQLRGCSQMPCVETSGRTDVARRPSHAQAPGPWRKPLSGEPRVWGGFTPERTFSSPRRDIWGPAHRGSHRHRQLQPLSSLSRRSAASPPVGASLRRELPAPRL